MLQEVFKQGTLEMSTSPLEPVQTVLQWGDCLSNRIACVLALVLGLIFIADYIRIFPDLLFCLSRAKGNTSLEHSISLERTRTVLAICMAIPFCLVVDRNALFTPSFWKDIDTGWSLLFIAAILLIYLILRTGMAIVCRPGKLKGENAAAVRNIIFNYYLVTVPVMLISDGICSFAGLGAQVTKLVLLSEMGLTFALRLMREVEISRAHCKGFSTFLYLCALEILPAGILIFASTR